MRAKPTLRTWIWPPPPVARQLWVAMALATAYTFAVLFLGERLIAKLPPWSTEFGLVNGIVMGVLVGLRVRAAFDRWTDGQKLWAEVVIHSRNLALKAAHLVRLDAPGRAEVSALLARFTEALVLRLRGSRDDANGPLAETGALLALAARWHRTGAIDLPGLWAWEANVRALSDAAGHCERVALAPVPASLHALLRHGLLVSFLLAPWHLIHALGEWALPVQALIIYFLFGIELTAEEIENPFGTDADDLPLGEFCELAARDVSAALAYPTEPPPPAAPAPLAATIPTVTDTPTEEV